MAQATGTEQIRNAVGSAAGDIAELPQRAVEGYADPSEKIPLGSYAVLAGTFLGALALGSARVAKGPGLRGLDGAELALLGVATHKLTRLVTKDWVTAFIRAPFVSYDSARPGGEVTEKSRGTGMRRALGDLLTCQFCTGPWIAGSLGLAMLAAPRPARFVASLLVAETISDWLHLGYQRAQSAASD